MIDQGFNFYCEKTRNKKMREVTGFDEPETSKLADFMRTR